MGNDEKFSEVGPIKITFIYGMVVESPESDSHEFSTNLKNMTLMMMVMITPQLS